DLSLSLGDPQAAWDSADKGWQVNHEVLRANLNNTQARQFVSLAEYLKGKALAHLGQPEKTGEGLNSSLAARLVAAKEDTHSASAQRELGATYDALGDLRIEQHEVKKAVANYQLSRDIYLALNKKEPDSAEDKWYLGWSYFRLGTAYIAEGKRSD